ncbi:MAG: hypothetical protein ACK56F_12350 [bacterium]
MVSYHSFALSMQPYNAFSNPTHRLPSTRKNLRCEGIISHSTSASLGSRSILTGRFNRALR